MIWRCIPSRCNECFTCDCTLYELLSEPLVLKCWDKDVQTPGPRQSDSFLGEAQVVLGRYLKGGSLRKARVEDVLGPSLDEPRESEYGSISLDVSWKPRAGCEKAEKVEKVTLGSLS